MSSPDDRIILTRGNLQALIDKIKAEITGPMALASHPVLSYYWSDDPTDPAILFGGGTWVRVKDTFIWAMGDNDTLGATGGSKTVTLTSDQMPSHTHTFTGTAHTHTFTGTAHTHTISGSTGSESSHTHNINGGGTSTSNEPSTLTAWFHGKSATSGDNSRGHTHTLSNHVHSMQSHTHSLNSHVHSMQSHTHNLAYDNNGSTAWASGTAYHPTNHINTKTLSGTLLVRAMEDSGPAISIKSTSDILSSGSESGSWYGADVQTGLTASNITINVEHSHSLKGHTSTPMNSTGDSSLTYTGTPVNSSGNVVATGASNTTYTGTPVNSSGTATDVTGGVSQTHTHSVTASGWVNGKTESGSSHSHGVGTLANVSTTATGSNSSTTATGSNSSTGGGAAHNNMPPYRCAYCWQRTA